MTSVNRFAQKQRHPLLQALGFVSPYRWQMVIAMLALIFTAAITLGLVQFVRVIVDSGFVAGSQQSLTQAIAAFIAMAMHTPGRFSSFALSTTRIL